nr:immunoglobulin heavy chain junction region [Mus musculus]NSM04129.1 immunoglobulin heavy chain junction region [Mus musculus]NSM05427.1 immunoglobulin heavy chain junction region [Mus musculus]NSM05432.1 immunoglobulin heavy chain junction region [Mus musculus]NSM06220.1 immunoglobulin heavy chain junction region [Mus musculus]
CARRPLYPYYFDYW